MEVNTDDDKLTQDIRAGATVVMVLGVLILLLVAYLIFVEFHLLVFLLMCALVTGVLSVVRIVSDLVEIRDMPTKTKRTRR